MVLYGQIQQFVSGIQNFGATLQNEIFGVIDRVQAMVSFKDTIVDQGRYDAQDYTAPFYVVYRSNIPGSSKNGAGDSY